MLTAVRSCSVALLLALAASARGDDECKPSFGDQLYGWASNQAAARSRALAKADYSARVFNALLLGYDNLHTRIEASTTALDGIADRTRAAEKELPSDDVAAAVARERTASELLALLLGQREQLATARSRLDAIAVVPPYEDFRAQGLAFVGRETLLAEFAELGQRSAKQLAPRFSISIEMHVEPDGTVTPGQQSLNPEPADTVVIAIAAQWPAVGEALGAIYLGYKMIALAVAADECDRNFKIQKERMDAAFALLPSKLIAPEDLYAMYQKTMRDLFETFREHDALVRKELDALDARHRELFAFNAQRRAAARSVLTAEKVRRLSAGYGVDAKIDRIFADVAISQYASDVGRLADDLGRREGQSLRACGDLRGAIATEDHLDALRYASAALAAYRREDALAPLHPLLDRTLAKVDMARHDAEERARDLPRRTCGRGQAHPNPIHASVRSLRRTALDARGLAIRSRRLAVATRVRSRSPAGSEGGTAFRNAVTGPSLDNAWKICALYREGDVYLCFGPGEANGRPSYAGQFGSASGDPRTDVLLGANDGGYAQDNRRVALEIAKVNANLDQRISDLETRAAAAVAAMPQWRLRNDAALVAAVSAEKQLMDVVTADRSSFQRVNQDAILSATASVERFLSSPLDRGAAERLLSDVGGADWALPSVPLDSISPDVPALTGITALDRAYGARVSSEEGAVVRGRRKADAELAGHPAEHVLSDEELRDAERFAADRTPRAVQLARALVDDAASLRFSVRGQIPAGSSTTIAAGGEVGRAALSPAAGSLPPGSLLARVRDFDNRAAVVSLAASVAGTALRDGAGADAVLRTHLVRAAEASVAAAQAEFYAGDLDAGDASLSLAQALLDASRTYTDAKAGRTAFELATGNDVVAGYVRPLAASCAKLGADAQAQLADTHVASHLDANAKSWLQDAVKASLELSRQAVDKASPVLTVVAYDSLSSIDGFLRGVASGIYTGFYDLSRAIETIARDPAAFVNGIMLTASDPMPFLRAVLNGYVQLAVTIAQGGAEARGRALGELGANVVVTLAAPEATAAVRSAIQTSVELVLPGAARAAVGDALVQVMERFNDATPELIGAANEGAPKLFGRSRVGESWDLFKRRPFEFATEDDWFKVRETFLGERVWSISPQPGETFYRVGKRTGNYWSRTKPISEIQVRIEKAMLPDWGDFTTMSEFTVPSEGLPRCFEGLVGPQGGSKRMEDFVATGVSPTGGPGTFWVGGTEQVYIPPSVVNTEYFKRLVREVPFK